MHFLSSEGTRAHSLAAAFLLIADWASPPNNLKNSSTFWALAVPTLTITRITPDAKRVFTVASKFIRRFHSIIGTYLMFSPTATLTCVNCMSKAVRIDFYGDVVLKATEWPTRDHSIKTLAKYLGFRWRDAHPSGAAAVEWFDRWCRERDPAVKQRILEYNEDDCRATRVLLDRIRELAT